MTNSYKLFMIFIHVTLSYSRPLSPLLLSLSLPLSLSLFPCRCVSLCLFPCLSRSSRPKVSLCLYAYFSLSRPVLSPSLSIYLSCDIHIHTPVRTSSTNFQLYYLLHNLVLQPVLGMGMGRNVTAHYCPRPRLFCMWSPAAPQDTCVLDSKFSNLI